MPDDSLLQIGEVARRGGVSLRTVRYYEELRLLTPSGWTSGGMRLYSVADVARLRVIRRLRALGLSLDEIKVALHLDKPSLSRPERISRTLKVLLMEQSRTEEQMAVLARLKGEVSEAIGNVRKCEACTLVECPEGCRRRAYLL